MDPIYGYQAVNVEAQSRSPSSLLNWMKRLIAVRRAHPAFGRGTLRFIRPGNRKILAYVREHGEESLLCVANLARSSQPVELDLSEYRGRVPVELLGGASFPPIGELPYLLTLPGWGFYWFELSKVAPMPDWHDERPAPSELPMLVIPEGLRAFLHAPEAGSGDVRMLMARRMRARLEREVLPVFLAAQRWFAAKGRTLEASELIAQDEWGTPAQRWLLGIARVRLDGGEEHTYSLPLALAWDDAAADGLQNLAHCTVARVRQHDRVGVILDAFWDDDFCRAVVDAMGQNREQTALDGRLRFWSTSAYAEAAGDGPLAVRHPTFEQSNTLAVLGERLVLKGYRRLRRGINPEIEIGRFLTEESPFPRIPALLGALEYESPAGETIALAVLHRFVDNQGNAWTYTIEYLRRALEASLASEDAARAVPDQASPVEASGSRDEHAAFMTMIGTLGQRTGEMHRALAARTGNPAFEPEPVDAAELQAWLQRVRDDVDLTVGQLRERFADLGPVAQPKAQALLDVRDALIERIGSVQLPESGVMKTRLHGDYHLGQLLVDHRDFVIVDFEGEPSRPPEERRAKHSPLRDVAGMLRSFGYAAAMAAADVTAQRPDDRVRLMPHAERWRRQASDTFLEAYLEHVGDCGACPADRDAALRLIDLFTFEKALYEVRYELGSRPDWVHVPLRGLLEMLGPAAVPGVR
jgi:maltose alpha-D-glucosyltransferase / alpha-amylase